MVNIHGKQYITVAERVQEAGKDFLELNTEVLFQNPVVIKATVKTAKGIFTGISAANPSKTIEKQSPYEVAETSAVGRALGFAGYGVVEGIASADEIAKVEEEPLPEEPTDRYFNRRDKVVSADLDAQDIREMKEDCPICHSDVYINEGVAGPSAKTPGKPWKNKKCKENKDHIVWWDFELDGWQGL